MVCSLKSSFTSHFGPVRTSVRFVKQCTFHSKSWITKSYTTKLSGHQWQFTVMTFYSSGIFYTVYNIARLTDHGFPYRAYIYCMEYSNSIVTIDKIRPFGLAEKTYGRTSMSMKVYFWEALLKKLILALLQKTHLRANFNLHRPYLLFQV